LLEKCEKAALADSMLSWSRPSIRAAVEMGAPFLPAFGRSGDFAFEVDFAFPHVTPKSAQRAR